jgi:hypothetical protein
MSSLTYVAAKAATAHPAAVQSSNTTLFIIGMAALIFLAAGVKRVWAGVALIAVLGTAFGVHVWSEGLDGFNTLLNGVK